MPLASRWGPAGSLLTLRAESPPHGETILLAFKWARALYALGRIARMRTVEEEVSPWSELQLLGAACCSSCISSNAVSASLKIGRLAVLTEETSALTERTSQYAYVAGLSRA